MGLSLNDVDDMYEMSPEVSSMLENRSSMRLNGNFVQADRLRSKMKAEGYLVEDLESSSTVRLKNLSELREDKWPTISSSADILSNLDSPDEFEFSVRVTEILPVGQRVLFHSGLSHHTFGDLSKTVVLLDLRQFFPSYVY